ncbi:hypothetical protein M885DRAFT_471813 [Pelagophyceae sp. CCMP2097]|nr:hypothetical protein M885DRAFT_471813 [Pelagophyceae sp. CCMP2097]
MGQKFGKAAFDARTRPFVNLSAGAIEAAWEAFNDVADGFGISLAEMKLICAELSVELELSKPQVDRQVAQLFLLLDTDKNGLVDSIEFMTALAVASGMTASQKLAFVFHCFDFDGAGALSVDECTLAMRCNLMGLCKITGEECPSEDDLEVVSTRAFLFADPDKPVSNDALLGPLTKLRILDAIAFCLSDPEALSWLEYFDDPDPRFSDTGEGDAVDVSTSKKDVTPLLVESITYVPTQSDEDYSRDGVRSTLPRDVAYGAALDSNNRVAEAEAQYWAQRRNPRSTEEPWVSTLKALTPTALANTLPDLNLPDSSLTLEWVHGYRGDDCRGNVRYTAAGEIVYPAARLAVVYSGLEHRQRHMTLHAGDVISLAVSPDGSVVATGDVGPRPSVICWDAASCQPLAVLKGVHSVGVSQLCFSPDGGATLATVGADLHSCVIAYDWKTRRRVFSSRADLGVQGCLGVSFVGDSSGSLCAVGVGDPFVVFWVSEGGKVIKRRGAFGRRTRRQPTLCVARCGANVTLTGQASGHLYVWHGRNCVQAIRGHFGSLNAIHVSKHGIVTGGKDGRVRLWSHALEAGATFNLMDLGAKPTMRSVCLSGDGAKLLVGTGGNEVYELSAADGSDTLGGPAASSHFGAPARAAAAHPLKPEFVTVGDDGTVRVWDVLTRSAVKATTLDGAVLCAAYHPNGDLIAVGLGAATAQGGLAAEARPTTANTSAAVYSKPSKEGAFCILNDADLTVAFEARDSALPITACRFTLDGEIVACASEDTAIYLYAVNEEYEAVGQCRRHLLPVRCFDFSTDSKWLRSCCDGGQLYFFNANSGQFQSNISALKDVRWATETCTLGYGVSGARKRAEEDGATITSCDRARGPTDGPESGGGYLASGDSYGRVRLQRWPAAKKEALQLDYRAHSGRIASAVFNSDQTHLITVGEDDRCIMQWILTEDDRAEEDADEVDEDEAEDYAPELQDASQLQLSRQRELCTDRANESALQAARGEIEGITVPIDSRDGVERLPWSSDSWALTLTPPSQPRKTLAAATTASLALSRVFGYSCGSWRNNAKYGNDSTCFYPAGSVLIKLDMKSGTQAFGTAHAGRTIAALALSDDGNLVATSEVSDEPTICIWDSADVSKGPRRILRESVPHKHAITLLCFSPRGTELASVGADERHTLALHDVESGHLVFSSATTQNKPLCIAFGRDGGEVVLSGIKHALFFSFAAGHAATRHATVTAARVGRGGGGVLQAFLCCAYLPSHKCVVGTSDGHLLVFHETTKVLEKSVKAHDDLIYAIDAPWQRQGASLPKPTPSAASICLATGARDCEVRLWNAALECILKFSNLGAGPVRSVSVSPDGSRVLVGSQAAAELREFRASDGQPLNDRVAGGGAAGGGTVGQWALASHFTEQRVATASDEGALCQWNLDDHDSTKARDRGNALLVGGCRALAFSPDGKLIAATLGGAKSGNARLAWARRRRDLHAEPSKSAKKGGVVGKKNLGDDDESAVTSASNAKIDGLLQLLRADTGALIYEFSEAREWLRDVKFSKDSHTIVAAGSDGNVHVYTSDDHGQFSLRCAITPGRQAALRTIDISANGQFAQVSDDARALSYADLRIAMAVPDSAAVKDVDWASWTAPIGWPTTAAHDALRREGLYELQKSEDEMQDDSRSELTLSCLTRSRSSGYAASGDHHGRLHLWRWPAPNAGASPAFATNVHVGVLRRIEWTHGDAHLVTLGGEDGTICVFRFDRDVRDVEDPFEEAGGIGVLEDDAVDGDGGRALKVQADRACLGKAAFVSANQPAAPDVGELRAVTAPEVDPSDPDALLKPEPIAPWISALVPPSNLEDEDASVPSVVVALECAHGNRSDDLRNCVAYNAQGAIVYPAGALGVIYDAKSHTQVFHHHHPTGAAPWTDAETKAADVSALAVTLDGRFCATADQGFDSRVRVWDATTGATVSVLPRHVSGGVVALAFSSDGRHLAVVADDQDHTYFLYQTQDGEWADAVKAAQGPGPRARVHCVAFVGKSAYPLFVGGHNSVEFVRPAACGAVRRRLGAFDGRRCPQTTVLCVARAFLDRSPSSYSADAKANRHDASLVSAPMSDADDDARSLCGCATGSLYTWKGSVVDLHVPKAHDGPIYSIAVAKVSSSGGAYATGGRDGNVKLWDATLRLLQTFRLSELVSAANGFCLTPHASSLSFGGQHATKLLVVARSGEIMELATASNRIVCLLESHAGSCKIEAREARGLDAHPTNGDIYATCGDDATVRVWSASRRVCVRRAQPEVLGGAAARCLAFSPDGGKLAIGLGGDAQDRARDGTLVLLRHVDDGTKDGGLEVGSETRKAKKPLTAVKWSPDGSLILAACDDGRVYVHDGRDGSLRTVCAPAGAPVTGLDLSNDGKYFQLATASDELQFYSVADGSRESSPGALRDEGWHTLNLPLGWDVRGCWQTFWALDSPAAAAAAAEEAPLYLGARRTAQYTPAVHAVARSPAKRFLAKACVDGTLAVYNFPTHAPGMGFKKLPGHASQIAAVRFTCDGKRLLALGQFNRTVTQYRLHDFDGPI